MLDDSRIVPVFSVDAAALDNDLTRVLAGRLISRASIKDLFEVIDAISAGVREIGQTEEILEAEFAASNAERRNRPPAA